MGVESGPSMEDWEIDMVISVQQHDFSYRDDQPYVAVSWED